MIGSDVSIQEILQEHIHTMKEIGLRGIQSMDRWGAIQMQFVVGDSVKAADNIRSALRSPPTLGDEDAAETRTAESATSP